MSDLNRKQAWIVAQASLVMATWKLGAQLTATDTTAVCMRLERYDVKVLKRGFELAMQSKNPPQWPGVRHFEEFMEMAIKSPARTITPPDKQLDVPQEEREEAEAFAKLGDNSKCAAAVFAALEKGGPGQGMKDALKSIIATAAGADGN